MRRALHISGLSHPFIQGGKSVDLLAGWNSVVLLCGANGSGKSTLLHCLFGGNHTDSICKDFDSDEIAFMPQQQERDFFLPFLLKDLLLEAFNSKFITGIDLSRPWNESSGGEKQRILLAMTCINHFKVWLLDEPFNHLDSQAAEVLKGAIEEHCSGGGLVVLSSHDPWDSDATSVQVLELVA